MNFAALSLTVVSLTIAGCTAFGPERSPPKMPLPEHYAAGAQAPTRQIDMGARPVPQW